jgi:hypothetical protein
MQSCDAKFCAIERLQVLRSIREESILAKAEKNGRCDDCCLANRNRSHKKSEYVPHSVAMPVVKKEYDGQHECYKVPQNLKPIHDVDFQGHAAE